ncbi:spermidine/putrescine ABC transporter substrate-binding protein [Erysipelothrix larvae]|uniref:Spermidine/putrescine ABC transporter substrate-binding protein n=1 Tax=Erysipelothrix larvae TaxID=1514105 RepID=A0A109UGY8_9FIRM|nr:ABC transporter substrate-binding protein [Erysipelothrix larvae]AMC93482.1 spermidine/putrescine ABC transporter substrate-binding protein [Erysipelothrix larvae]
MKKLGLGLIASLVLLSGCSTGNKDSETRELVISTWGLSEDVLMEDVYGPFEEAFNVKIVLDTGTTSERYTKLANDSNSTVDIIDLSQKAAADGYEAGLFEKLDYSKIPNAQDLIPSAKSLTETGFGPAYTINSIGIIYNPETVSIDIKEWSDLWDPSLKGRISIPDISTTFGPATIVMASDVKGVDIKSDNGAAAFSALEALKPNVLKTYSKSSDLAMMFANGEIDVAIVGDFGFPVIKNALDTVKYIVPASGTYANFNTVDINVNSKNKDLAYEFINFRLSVQQQLQNASAQTLNEAPVNSNVELSDEDAQNKTYGDIANRAKALDYSFINPLMSEWIDQYNRIMNQ